MPDTVPKLETGEQYASSQYLKVLAIIVDNTCTGIPTVLYTVAIKGTSACAGTKLTIIVQVAVRVG